MEEVKLGEKGGEGDYFGGERGPGEDGMEEEWLGNDGMQARGMAKGWRRDGRYYILKHFVYWRDVAIFAPKLRASACT